MLLDLAYPITNRFKGTAVSNIVDKNDPLRPTEIRRCDSAKSFLTGGIPNLKLHALIVDFDVFDFEIDSNRRDKRGRERVIGISEKQARFPDSGISNHEEFDLHIVSGCMTHCIVRV